MIQEMDICEYIKIRSKEDILIDLRERLMFEFGTVPGAVNIPLESIKELYRLPKDQNIYVFCQTGEISAEIVELLSDAGYNAFNLIGGYREYLRWKIAAESADVSFATGGNRIDCNILESR